MRIWALTHLDATPATRRFLAAAEEAGHRATLVNPLAPGFQLDEGDCSRALLGSPDALPDLVFTRMGGSTPERGFDFLRALEALGVPGVNRSAALLLARDKIGSLGELARAALPVPATLVLGERTSMETVTERLGEPPWVLKTTPGTKGEGVMLVESEAALEALAAPLFGRNQRFLVQRFIRESAGSDVRVLVIGGRAIVAMRRQAAAGEFRSNLHQGGTAEPFELTAELTDLAERAARTAGLDVAGIDLLPAKGGPLVLEVNGSPGLAGIEDATGVDVSALVVRFLESLVPG